MMRATVISLRSVDSRSNPIRPFTGGRALDVRNVDIVRTGEPQRRPGLAYRLEEQRSGLGTFIMPFGGICGRYLPRLVSIWPDGIHVDASPGGLAALDSFAAVRGASGDLSWTYFGGGATPNEGCEGVRILRRYDETPKSYDDPDAQVVYEGADASFSDTAAPDGEALYYAAYAQYPGAAFALGRAASLAQLLLFEDTFSRPGPGLSDPEHPWVTDGITIVNGEAYAAGTDDLEAWMTLAGVDVIDRDPVTIRLKLIEDDGLWDIGWYNATQDRRVFARVEKAGDTELLVHNGVSSVGGTDGVPPSTNTVLTFRREGDVLTATHGTLTATIAKLATAPGDVVYPYMAIDGIAGSGQVRADDFSVRAE